MSLIVCSNKADEDLDSETNNNINKPFSFRNGLSSTYKIPKNAQVALQSVKYALEGTISLSTDSRILYQYYGEDLNEVAPDTSDATIQTNSTAVPIKTSLVDTFTGTNLDSNTVRTYSISELKKEMGKQIGEKIYHPNLRFLSSVDLDQHTSGEFKGFKINYGFYTSMTSTIPTDDFAEDMNDFINDGIYDQSWNYESGLFTSGAPNDRGTPQAAILTQYPISLYDGILKVNFSNANEANKEWAVGLSRYVNQTDDLTGVRRPSYFSRIKSGEDLPNKFFGFYDYLVCRKGNLLKVYHTPYDSTEGADKKICSRELTPLIVDYDLSTNTQNYQEVVFQCKGQQIVIELIKDDASVTTLYQYDETKGNDEQLKAICQSTWNMYPVLYLEDPNLEETNSLEVLEYTGVQSHDPAFSGWEISQSDSSWYNSVEGKNNLQYAVELETRIWNDNAEEGRENYLVYKGLDEDNGIIDLSNALITKPSNIYSPSIGANTSYFLGFVSNTPTTDVTYGDGSTHGTSTRIFTSSNVPLLVTNKSMFVKLENLTQQSMNAFQGNRSTIIGHVPRFDGQDTIGRIYYEPNTLLFMDLNNSNEINISSFDISLCHINEQFAESLTGQTIVTLYIRQKPV